MALAYAGFFGTRELLASLLLLPGLMAGYLAAPWLVRLLSPAAARAGLLAISALSGVLLIMKG